MTQTNLHSNRSGACYQLDAWFDAGLQAIHLDNNNGLVNGLPVAPLSSFEAAEEMEETLLRWLRNICVHPRLAGLANLKYFGVTRQSVVVEYNPEAVHFFRKQLGSVDEYLAAAGYQGLKWARETSALKSVIATGSRLSIPIPDGSLSLSGMILRKALYPGDEYKLVNVFMLASVQRVTD